MTLQSFQQERSNKSGYNKHIYNIICTIVKLVSIKFNGLMEILQLRQNMASF
jgi:uncharacterized pyridoxal phosphate-containing UPF0001 family protein